MSSRYWLCALGLAGCLSASAFGQEKQLSVEAPSANRSGDAAVEAPSVLQVSDKVRARVMRDEEERQYKRDHPYRELKRWVSLRDTFAQWIAALAAVGGAAISGIAVKFVRDTLTLNRKATEAAVAAVGIAERTFEETRSSNQRQLRAYVQVEKVEVGEGGASAILTVKNFGQTPAINMTVRAERRVCAPIPKNEVLAFTENAEILPGYELPPGHIAGLRMTIVEALAARRMAPGSRNAYVWGRIEYRDVFGQHNWTTFQLYNELGEILTFALSDGGNATEQT